jgi:hypothetical protein
VNTPGGPVQVALQGGTFVQGPTPQSVTPPQGFQAPYGGIAFTAQVAQGGSLTKRSQKAHCFSGGMNANALQRTALRLSCK